MNNIVRSNSTNPDFISLVQQLDIDLAKRDGNDHAFYHQFNSIQSLNHVVIVYDHEIAISCGAFKEVETGKVEIKRMYTSPAYRSKGYASIVLQSLEKWATELGYASCVLETGKRQPEAIQLYKKNGYTIIPNYGQYVNVDNSICMEKSIA